MSPRAPHSRPAKIQRILVALALALLPTAVCTSAAAKNTPHQRAKWTGSALLKQVRRVPKLLRLGRNPATGLGFCRAAVDRMGREQGKPVCVVFDVDNTLVDTRVRTLAAAHAFGRKANQSALSRLKLGQVGYTGALTARDQGLGRILEQSFGRFWSSYFWNPTNFKHDRPIRQTVQLARKAKQAGAEIFYLTGRVEASKSGTMQQLRRLGLPDADAAHVICKPDLASKTAPFKRSVVDQLRTRQGRKIAWFMSDSSADIAHMRGSGVACVWVDFPVKPPQDTTVRGVPTIRIRSSR